MKLHLQDIIYVNEIGVGDILVFSNDSIYIIVQTNNDYYRLLNIETMVMFDDLWEDIDDMIEEMTDKYCIELVKIFKADTLELRVVNEH